MQIYLNLIIEYNRRAALKSFW